MVIEDAAVRILSMLEWHRTHRFMGPGQLKRWAHLVCPTRNMAVSPASLLEPDGYGSPKRSVHAKGLAPLPTLGCGSPLLGPRGSSSAGRTWCAPHTAWLQWLSCHQLLWAALCAVSLPPACPLGLLRDSLDRADRGWGRPRARSSGLEAREGLRLQGFLCMS